MVGAAQQAGIYFNRQSNRVRRVGIGIAPPAGAEWSKLSDDPNASLLALRDLARQTQASAQPDAIHWE